MANDTALLSTASSALEDAVTSIENNTSALSNDLTSNIWQYAWPLSCLTGLVGNTLVLLVLRRDGLVRTSANVYLSALAVGDSFVLMVVTVAVYPVMAWGWWFDKTSRVACRAVWSIHHILLDASSWLIVAFTAERCIAVRFPLLKLRLCTPRNAGLCFGSLLALAFIKNIDLFFILNMTISGSGDVVCDTLPRYQNYAINYRRWITLVACSVIPTWVVFVCNWAIIRTLRRDLTRAAMQDSVRRTACMCLGVSIAYIVCIVPVDVFFVNYPNWPMTRQSQYDVICSLLLLRYVNHAINFFLYSLTGAHFRRELVALFRSCIQRACAASAAAAAAAAVVRGMPFRVSNRFHFRRRFEDEIEMG